MSRTIVQQVNDLSITRRKYLRWQQSAEVNGKILPIGIITATQWQYHQQLGRMIAGLDTQIAEIRQVVVA